jgi:hypothetical protein
MRIRLPRAIGDLPQKAIAILLLLGLVAEIAGIPVVSVAKKDRSRPYPCQDRPCGCASADECWHHCCCMNNKQKLAWAREHGITPPDFVIAAAERENDHSAEVCDRADDSHGDDARESTQRACCRKRHQDQEVATCCHHDHDKAKKSKTEVRLVLSDSARQCSGLPQLVLLFSDALPCVATPEWRPLEAQLGYVVEGPRSCLSADLSPPVPPPKLYGGVAA